MMQMTCQNPRFVQLSCLCETSILKMTDQKKKDEHSVGLNLPTNIRIVTSTFPSEQRPTDNETEPVMNILEAI